MGEVSYRTSFVLCSLPFVAVVTDAMDIHPQFSRIGLALAAVIWVVLLHRIGRGGTPAGASGREVAILRPTPGRLVAMLLADNASRTLLCLVVAAASFSGNWPFAVALYVATRLVGFRSYGALAAVAALGATAALADGPARTISIVAAGVLVVWFAVSAVADRFALRALASGTDGTDARFMVQIGDWHGLVARLVDVARVPSTLVWVVLLAGSWSAAHLMHLPDRLFVPILAFVAAHVSCRIGYDAWSQPDRRRLAVRAAGGPARVVIAILAASVPAAAIVTAVVAVVSNRSMASAAVVVWELVLAEAFFGAALIAWATSVFGAMAFGQATFAIRSLAVAVGIGVAYVPPGQWSVPVSNAAVVIAAAALGISAIGAARATL